MVQSRDFVHVRDIARANVVALKSSGADFRAVNVGSGASVTVLEIFQKLSTILNVPMEPTITRRYRSGDIRHCFSDSSHARSLLGWEPEVKLEAGLKDLVWWCLDSVPEARDLFEMSYSELEQRNLAQ